MASPDLIWHIIRNNHAFLVKRDGQILSSEPGNLLNRHSFKYSGIANRRTLDVLPGKKGVVLRIKTGKRAQKPACSATEIALERDTRSIARAIANETARKRIRADLKQAALARMSAILRSRRPVKTAPKKLSLRQLKQQTKS